MKAFLSKGVPSTKHIYHKNSSEPKAEIYILKFDHNTEYYSPWPSQDFDLLSRFGVEYKHVEVKVR